MIGASVEVLAEHARRHPCQDATCVEVVCPCGSALALVCGECRQPVYVAVRPGAAPCEHARELMGEEP